VLSPFTVAVNCWVDAAATVAEPGAMPAVELVMVTEAEADADVSACETAATVTVGGLGTASGAVYIPLEDMVPIAEFPPAVPFTCQVTVSSVAFVTVAMNCCSAPTPTVADVGEIATTTDGVFLLLAQLRNNRVRLTMRARNRLKMYLTERSMLLR
jgi:hypothetical protein